MLSERVGFFADVDATAVLDIPTGPGTYGTGRGRRGNRCDRLVGLATYIQYLFSLPPLQYQVIWYGLLFANPR